MKCHVVNAECESDTRKICFACGEPVCVQCSRIREWYRYNQKRICDNCHDEEERTSQRRTTNVERQRPAAVPTEHPQRQALERLLPEEARKREARNAARADFETNPLHFLPESPRAVDRGEVERRENLVGGAVNTEAARLAWIEEDEKIERQMANEEREHAIKMRVFLMRRLLLLRRSMSGGC